MVVFPTTDLAPSKKAVYPDITSALGYAATYPILASFSVIIPSDISSFSFMPAATPAAYLPSYMAPINV